MSDGGKKPLWDRFSTAYLSFLRNLPAASFLLVIGIYVLQKALGPLDAEHVFRGLVGLIAVGAALLAYFANGHEMLRNFSGEEKKRRIVIGLMTIMMVCTALFIDQSLWVISKLIDFHSSSRGR